MEVPEKILNKKESIIKINKSTQNDDNNINYIYNFNNIKRFIPNFKSTDNKNNSL